MPFLPETFIVLKARRVVFVNLETTLALTTKRYYVVLWLLKGLIHQHQAVIYWILSDIKNL